MTQRQLTPADYLAMFRRRWTLILAVLVLGGPLGYGVARVVPTRFKSQTLVLVDQPSVPSDIVKPVDSTDINQRLASMQEQILSRSRLEPIIRKYDLYPKDISKVPMDDLVAKLQKSIEVTPIEPMAEIRTNDLPGFYITVTMEKAQIAQEVCAAVTSMFISENNRLRQSRSQETTQFLGQQLGDAKQKLDEQDAKLAAFKSRNIGTLPDEEQTNLNLLMGLTSQLDAATQALARAQQDKTFAESMLSQQLAAWQATQEDKTPDTQQTQLAALESQLTSLRARYTDDYPDVIKTKNDIAALKAKMADTELQKSTQPAKAAVEPPQIQQLRAQAHTFDQVIAEKTREQDDIKRQIGVYQGRVQSSPAIEQEYKQLTRDYQTAQDFYNDLLKKRDQSAMATDLERQQEGEQFRVLDPANLPDKPAFPNRLFFTLGGFGGGLAFGLGLAFLLEMKDTSFKTEGDVEFALRLPVLAMVPDVAPGAARNVKAPAGPPPS